MPRSLAVLIGLRFTRSKNSNIFLSFMTLVSMAGLVIGVAALIVVTSVLNGFEGALASKILGMVPQVTINSSQPIKNWEAIAEAVEEKNANIMGSAPLVQGRGMLSISGEVNSTIFNGIDPKYESNVSILKDNMVQGSLTSLKTDSNNIVLGEYIVDSYNLELGDQIGVIIAKPSDSNAGTTPVFHTFTLTGVFHVSREIDKWMSYISINDASNILGLQAGVTTIRFKTKDVFTSSDTASDALELAAGLSTDELYSRDWTQSHGSLYSAIRMQKTIMTLLLFLIILVAAFNIISALVMNVTEKKSDVAILKTFGATSQLITRIFIVQGTVIGIVGTLLGVVLGVVVTLNIEFLSGWVNNKFELGLFDNYYVEALPAAINIYEIILIAVTSILAALVSTIYPARSAAKIEPVKVLNSE